MKVSLSIAAVFIMGLSIVKAQSLGEFKPGKSGPSTLEKRKFKSKDVFIADFAIHYQVYGDRTSTNKGNSLAGTLMGKSKASLIVGLDVPTATLEKIADESYTSFVNYLKEQGFNVVNPEAAKSTDYYKGYNYSTNLSMVASSSMEGGITLHPKNAGFFYKKSGPYASYTKLSSELNDVVVIRVDMYVEFVKLGDFNKGFGASVNAKTNLVLSQDNTIIHFIVGRNKIGGSPLAEYQGILKKDLDIDDVVKEEKISSYASYDYDNVGVKTAFGTVYTAKNITNAKVSMVSADSSKYEKGVEMAISTFLNHHVSEFNDKFFK